MSDLDVETETRTWGEDVRKGDKQTKMDKNDACLENFPLPSNCCEKDNANEKVACRMMIEAYKWFAAYLLCTDSTVSALLVKLGRSTYNLAIQHLRVLISLELPLSPSSLNLLLTAQHFHHTQWEQEKHFFPSSLLFFPMQSFLSIGEQMFLHAVLTDAYF